MRGRTSYGGETSLHIEYLITMQKPVQDNPESTYLQKTARLQAWSQLIKSITPFIWAAVILVVIVPLLGKTFIASVAESEVDTPVAVVDRPLNQPQLQGAIATAVQAAHTQAENYASQELEQWVDKLTTRVDQSFLPWYFNYFNQKQMEFSAPFIWLSSAVRHSLAQNASPNEAVAERLTETFQTEFAKRVLRPQIAQLELERITRETINVYVSELSSQFAQIQSSYSIPQGQWERYLGDIAITIGDTEGRSDLSLKLLAGGSTYLLAKAMLPVATKVGSKVAAAFAGKASAKLAAKTGSAVATKLGGQLIDPIVAVGIIIWDVWDYRHTVKIEQPLLREAILDYLEEVKASLLDNHQNSIMSAVYQLEASFLKSPTALSASFNEA